MPSLHSDRQFWFDAGPARMLELEREWLGGVPETGPDLGALWIAPRARGGDAPAAIELALDAYGRLSGALSAHASALPFADSSLRRIVLQHVIEHAGVPTTFLGECARVLGPGGELCVLGTNPASAAGFWLGVRARRAGTRLGPRLPNRVRALLQGIGFSGFSVDVRGPRWPGRDAGDAQEWARSAPFGAAYLLRARKSGANVIPLRARPASFAVPAVGFVLTPMPSPRVRAAGS